MSDLHEHSPEFVSRADHLLFCDLLRGMSRASRGMPELSCGLGT